MTNIYDPEPHTLPLLRACEAAPEMAPFFGVNLAYLPQIGTVARTAPKRPRSSKGVPSGYPVLLLHLIAHVTSSRF